MRERGFKVVALFIASAVAIGGLLGVTAPIGAQSTPTVPPLSPVTFERFGGADRYATALRVADEVVTDAGGTVKWAVLVSGTSWPDAVVASSLAGALGAPLVLTPPGELHIDVQRFLESAEVSDVLVVGSAASPGISDDVFDELVDRGYMTERVTGDDRYLTSVSAARRLGKVLQARSTSAPRVGDMPGLGRTAIVASGEVFADALVSGPIAAVGRHHQSCSHRRTGCIQILLRTSPTRALSTSC